MSRNFCGLKRVWLDVLLLSCTLSFATNVSAQPITAITGKCACDSTLNITRCEYSIFIGEHPIQQIVVPVPPTCGSGVKVFSPFFNVSGPTDYKDPVCGNGSGMLLTADKPVTKMAKTTIVYEGICSVGVVLVKARTTLGECLSIPVPGVVDCIAEPYIAWRVEGTNIEIAARKMGTFASPILSMTATSNTNSGISFSGFGELMSSSPSNSGPPISISLQIDEGCVPNPPLTFLTSEQFNALHLSVPGTEIPFQFCVWAKFDITPEHNPSDYVREAVIRLQMENHKVFLDTSP